MHRYATQVLKIRDFTTTDDIQKLIKTAQVVRLALAKPRSVDLLDKETVCCILATD
jgi:hypothetical protein